MKMPSPYSSVSKEFLGLCTRYRQILYQHWLHQNLEKDWTPVSESNPQSIEQRKKVRDLEELGMRNSAGGYKIVADYLLHALVALRGCFSTRTLAMCGRPCAHSSGHQRCIMGVTQKSDCKNPLPSEVIEVKEHSRLNFNPIQDRKAVYYCNF